ncbi:MAG: hypothetical protein LBM62_06115, partial [Mediterranea sp.]|nr:hypothetical protein [Mediterranea sp.]
EYLLAADAFNEEAYICLVESYLAQQQFDEPLRILDEAIELIPISIPLYQERAKVKRLMGDDEGAAADEQQAAELLTEE